MDESIRDDRQTGEGLLWIRLIGTTSLLLFVILPVLAVAALGMIIYLTIDAIRRVRWHTR